MEFRIQLGVLVERVIAECIHHPALFRNLHVVRRDQIIKIGGRIAVADRIRIGGTAEEQHTVTGHAGEAGSGIEPLQR